jgi:hypothetical protein
MDDLNLPSSSTQSHDQISSAPYSMQVPPSISPFPSQRTVDLILLHRLPTVLSHLGEADVRKVAYACEIRDALEKQKDNTEENFHHMALVTEVHKNQFLKAKKKLRKADEQLSLVIDVAIREASGTVDAIPDGYLDHGAVRGRLRPRLRPTPYTRMHTNASRPTGKMVMPFNDDSCVDVT